jgi:hypothetical protein
MKKVNYRCFSIYAEPDRTSGGKFDARVILQKIGTSKITLHRADCPQPTAAAAEDLGIATGKKIADEKKCPQ